MKKHIPLLFVCYFLIIAGCAPKEQGNAQIDYEQTKKMVVDILKTDEGKKAIEEIMTDEKMKQNFVLDQTIVTQAIESTITSDKGSDFWKKAFEDPKFAESFAKSMQKEHEKLIKDLMKDPDYQAMMIEILKNPELEKEMLSVLRSQEYRKHLQQVIQETFESPLFKAKIQDLLIKAAEEMQSGKQGENKEGDEGGQEQESEGGQ
ncbi:spore gernimation protein GerD [Bacillus timonensis]|nr:spore gernimation protein GerD [Bacillus timonensis]